MDANRDQDAKLSRRDFLKVTGALGVASALPAMAQECEEEQEETHEHSPRTDLRPSTLTYQFFTAPEVAFVTAAVDRLIPADGVWPSASQAGVVEFIDQQLAGAPLYLKGSFKQGTPQQGYQLPLTPAELFRTTIAAIDRYVAQQFGHQRFADLTPADQDKVLAWRRRSSRSTMRRLRPSLRPY